ncbi:MAG TPA: hypothetical protein VNZ03_11965 [Terriglobales bacterium]|nr:hypothetical protein [Terriglobales bacterium]
MRLLTVLLLAGSCYAQPFHLDRWTVSQLAASATDAYATYRNTQRSQFRENDPIAKPFMGSTAGLATFFILDAGVKLGSSALLRRQGHRRWARAVQVFGVADNAEGAFFSLINHHGKR